MDYLDNEEFGIALSNNEIYNKIGVFVFGRNSDVDTAANEDVWNGGGNYVSPTQARVHNIASSSASDTSAGTGARTLNILGLDSTYSLISEDITLNGVSNVATVNSYIFIQNMRVLTAGSGGSNAGTITATAVTDATVSASMGIGYNRTTLGIYQVPAGYTAFITKVNTGFQQSSASSTCDIALFIKPFGEVFQLYDIYPLTNSGTNNDGTDYDVPIKVLEKGIIKCRTLNVSANNNDVHCAINIILVKN